MSSGNFMLVNSDGYWLSSPDSGAEWGFMFADKRDRRFSSDFPGVWKKILSSQETQIENEKGLFTSATVYPGDGKFQKQYGIGRCPGGQPKAPQGQRVFLESDFLCSQ